MNLAQAGDFWIFLGADLAGGAAAALVFNGFRLGGEAAPGPKEQPAETTTV